MPVRGVEDFHVEDTIRRFVVDELLHNAQYSDHPRIRALYNV